MASIATWIRTRIIPAILTALGITFLAAGLLSFTTPVAAVPAPTPTPAPSQEATVEKTPVPLITLPPIQSVAPSTPRPIPVDRAVTRVRVAALKIDLPVIRDPGVPCDVALEYVHKFLGVPGQGRATYLYSHAQTGMFLPLLTQSKISNGKNMIGKLVEVWTNDDQHFLYVITKVYRNVNYNEVFDRPFAVKSNQIWLQTSEGKGTEDKLQVVGELLSQDIDDHAAANPKPHPKAPTKVGSGNSVREVC